MGPSRALRIASVFPISLLCRLKPAKRRAGTFSALAPALAFAALLMLSGCATSTVSVAPTATATASPTATSAATATATTAPGGGGGGTSGYPVQVYFSKHPESDANPSTVVPVSRTSPDLGVATYAVKQLLAGPTASEAAAGYYTELPASLSGPSTCGGPDFQITISGTTSTLRFCRATSLAGDLTGARIQAQITKTLLQFPNVNKAVILNKDGNCFNDLSGMNACLH